MSDYVLKVQVSKHTSDRDEAIIYEDSYEVKDEDVTGLIAWLMAVFAKWFWI